MGNNKQERKIYTDFSAGNTTGSLNLFIVNLLVAIIKEKENA